MKINLSLLLVVLFLASCSSSKQVVRTTAKPKVASKTKPVAHNKSVKKTTAPDVKPKVDDVTYKPTTTPNNNSEVTLEATSNVKTYAQEVQAYVDSHKLFAEQSMKAYGIPASITLAQGILESGAGKGKLALSANNHFGIKCHKEWSGPSVKHDDDSEQECFRKYDHSGESYRDHSLFLTSRPRYANLFKLDKGDYKSWAKGLKAAGYATDVKYPEKLIGIIERFELYKYDNEVLGRNYTPSKLDDKVIVANASSSLTEPEYYTIQQGDTLYSLSKKFNLTIDNLKKLNNMSDNTISIGQQIKVK